jgi:EAL domain-containing protein (putative c-di-GMP-specific phosphodiesterase class I)
VAASSRRAERSHATDTAGSLDRIDFLQSLAGRIGVRLIVFVSVSLRTATMWVTVEGDDVEVQQLTDVGRASIEAATLRGGAQSADVTAPQLDPGLAVTTVSNADGELGGALVASKGPGGLWTAAERALLDFTAEFYGTDLVAYAARPRPRPRRGTDGGRRRSGATPRLETWMRSAPDRGELFLLYQPEIDMRTGDIVAVEALVRWDHPQHGQLGPESFIALAERSDLILLLGTWVIEESLRQLAAWSESVPNTKVLLRVNVSPVQLVGPAIVELLARALDKSGVPGDQVCVEVTENAVHADIDALATTLRELKKLGITSAIDDLATGYSTLGRLRYLPVDTIKIDRSLVSGIDQDPRAQAIVAAIIALGSELGIEVMAEGVESSAEARELLQLGCVRAQGHYFARPMAAGELVDLLRQGRITPSV